MYKLTLTNSERMAFDFVGSAYSTGDIRKILWHNLPERVDIEDLWNCYVDVEFDLPEHEAWEIKRLAEEDNFLFPLFCESLSRKMREFCDNIV